MMRNRFTDPLRAAAKYPTGVVLYEHRGWMVSMRLKISLTDF